MVLIWLLMGMGILNILVMLVPLTFPLRSGYMTMIFFTVASLRGICLMDRLNIQREGQQRKNLFVKLAFFLCMISMFFYTGHRYILYEQEQQFLEVLKEGRGREVAIPVSRDDVFDRFFIDFSMKKAESGDQDFCYNRLMAMYYGASSISFKDSGSNQPVK